MNPLVSVIIPNYNHAKYLKQRINSILGQTYKNIEIIILDDKSTDNSLDVIKEYESNHLVSQIIINEKNSGSTFIQWNKGFSLAKGEYIWIAESDDFCDSSLLKTLVTEMTKDEKNVLCFCLSQFVNSEGNIIPPYLKTKRNKSLHSREFISQYMTYGNKINNASSAIFKKKVLKEINADYMKYTAAGDRLFWIEIAQKGNVIIVNQPLNYFRQHNQKVSPKKLLNGTTFIEDYQIYNYLKQLNYISWFYDYFIRNHYTYKILQTSFNDNEIQEKVLKLWNKTPETKNISYSKCLFIEFLFKSINKLRTI